MPSFLPPPLPSGHTVECGTFLLREAIRTKSKDLKTFTLKHFIDQPLQYGEDEKFGGYFYFLDVDGKYCNSGIRTLYQVLQ